MRSLFVSHVFEDAHYVEKMDSWAKEGRLGDDARVTGEADDRRAEGEQAVKNHLNAKLKGASAIAVLVGDDTHDRPWVDYEVQHAQSHHKPIIVVRIPRTRGAAPRAVRRLPEVVFEPTAVRNALGW